MSRARGERVLRRLLPVVLRHRGLVVGSLLALLLAAGLRVGLTWLVKLWADLVVLPGWDQRLALLLPLAAGALGLLALLVLASRWLVAALDLRVLDDLRSEALAALFRAEARRVEDFRRGDLQTRVLEDAREVSGIVQEAGRRLLGDVLVAVACVAMMLWIDLRLTLAAAVVVPLAAALLRLANRALRRKSELSRRELGRVGALLHEQLEGFETVQEARAEAFERARFRRAHEAFRRATFEAEGWGAVSAALAWLVAGAVVLSALVYGSARVASGALTSGDLLAFCLFAGQAAEPLRRFGELKSRLERAFAAGARLFEIVDLEPARSAGAPLPERRGCGLAVRLRGVRAAPAHGGGEDAGPASVLRAVDLELAAGEMVALVGASGAGKTTLARLLAGRVAPLEGSVEIGGVPVPKVAPEELRERVVLVPPDPFLFTASWYDNLRYGAFETTRDRAVAALQAVGLESVVARRGGLDAPLREAGADLSAGERQRLSLARAVLRDPDLLILDEATGAVDAEVEARLYDALDGWLRSRTILVISHRLSTVRRCPRALLLAEGAVAADGPPSALAAQPAYRLLFADQLAAAGARLA